MSDEARVSVRERFTRIEFVVVIIVIAITLLIFSTSISRTWALKQRLSCQSNLKTIGAALRMFASESKSELYPRSKLRDCAGIIQPWSGALDLKGFSPEYLENLDLLVCPSYPAGESAMELWDEGKTTNPRWKALEGFSHNGKVEPCEVLAKPYYYYGWALSEASFESAPRTQPLEPEDAVVDGQKGGSAVRLTMEFSPDIHFERFKLAVLSLTEGLSKGAIDETSNLWEMKYPNGKPVELPMGTAIFSLREGAERAYCRDIGNPSEPLRAQARIVVMHEEVFNARENFYHQGGGTNILFMDGHVECRPWMPIGLGLFPLNEAGLILHDAVEGTLTATSASASGVN